MLIARWPTLTGWSGGRRPRHTTDTSTSCAPPRSWRSSSAIGSSRSTISNATSIDDERRGSDLRGCGVQLLNESEGVNASSAGSGCVTISSWRMLSRDPSGASEAYRQCQTFAEVILSGSGRSGKALARSLIGSRCTAERYVDARPQAVYTVGTLSANREGGRHSGSLLQFRGRTTARPGGCPDPW